MYARLCSIKWHIQFQKSCKISAEFCVMWRLFWAIQTLLRAFDFCLAKMFTSTWVFWLCLSTFSLSIFTLFAYIFITISSKKRNFSLPILETRSSVFVPLLLNWLKCVRINKDLCIPSPSIVRTNCSQSEIKHVLVPNLLLPCYKRINSCF